MTERKKIAGIVAEYNPFHKGHAYQIEQTKFMTGADYCVAVMSGYFVQRGEPAIFDPFRRAAAALEGGADAVFMLPVSSSTASAEGFAGSGASILDSLGCDYISFGSECGDMGRLNAAADMMMDTDGEYGFKLKEHLKAGMTYPEAVTATLSGIRLSPNDILAVEYIKAVRCKGLRIRPVAVKRIGSRYHDSSLNSTFPSATAIRRAVLSEAALTDEISAVSPDDCLPYLISLLHRLKYMNADLTVYQDVSREIADRIMNTDLNIRTYDELIGKVKTRQYTYTRIARCMMHIMLDIRKGSEAAGCPSEDTGTYVQLLGFRRYGQQALSIMKERGSAVIVSKPADYREVLKKEQYSSEVYGQIYFRRFGKELPDLMRSRIAVLS